MDLFSRLILHSLDGIVFGWLYALIAFGLSLIFGFLNIVNVAHGALYMLGAVFGWFIAAELSGGNFWLALLLAPLMVCALSMVFETVVLRPIGNNSDMSILSTFGAMLIIENVVLGWIGGQGVTFDSPFHGKIPIIRYSYPTYRLFVMGSAMVVTGARGGRFSWRRGLRSQGYGSFTSGNASARRGVDQVRRERRLARMGETSS